MGAGIRTKNLDGRGLPFGVMFAAANLFYPPNDYDAIATAINEPVNGAVYDGIDGFKLGTATTAIATELFSLTAHGLVAGDIVRFDSITTTTNISTGVNYFVIAAGLTANVFSVSTTSGGAAVDLQGGDGSVVLRKLRTPSQVNANGYLVGPVGISVKVSTTTTWVTATLELHIVGELRGVRQEEFITCATTAAVPQTYFAGVKLFDRITLLEHRLVSGTADIVYQVGFGDVNAGSASAHPILVGLPVPSCSDINKLKAIIKKTDGTTIVPNTFIGTAATAFATDLFTLTAHGLVDGDQVRFEPATVGGSLPAGLTTGNYYVDQQAANTFKVSFSNTLSPLVDLITADSTVNVFRVPGGLNADGSGVYLLGQNTSTWIEYRLQHDGKPERY